MITQDGVLNLQSRNIQQLNIQTNNNKDADKQNKPLDFNSIFRQKMLGQKRFDTVIKLDLQNNKIMVIDAEFCKSLPNVEVLDLRSNRIVEISPTIKAMMSIRVLKLDKNDLSNLPEEVFDIIIMEELTFQQNKIQVLSPKIGQLIQLKKLNMASNMISKIPEEIGKCQELETLCIQNNRFASFPCSFVLLTKLKELSLEWFRYAKPPKQIYISRDRPEGTQIFESLMVLCNLLKKYQMNECALITFLENYSDDNFDKNQRDNRQRTPLHKAANMGDTGVIEGLLMDKADTDLLDKDNCTPLCLAIRQEHYQAAQSLIDGKSDVNLGGGILGSPVHLAVVKLEIPIIQSLIDKKADLNKQDSNGNTPLHLIMNIFSKNPEKSSHILQLLAINGASVNQINNDLWTPLHTAVRKGQERGVDAIIKLGKKLEEKGFELLDLNAMGGVQQWSPLHLAAHSGQIKIICDLARAGVDIFQRNKINQSARHFAKGNYMVTKLLKLIEQKSLASKYKQFQMNEFKMIVASAKDQQMVNLKQADDKGNNLFSYQSFTNQLRGVKREYVRPLTHLQNQTPMKPKSMNTDGLNEQDTENNDNHEESFIIRSIPQVQNRKIANNKQESPNSIKTISEGLDEEFDVIDEDEQESMSRILAVNLALGPSSSRGHIRGASKPHIGGIFPLLTPPDQKRQDINNPQNNHSHRGQFEAISQQYNIQHSIQMNHDQPSLVSFSQRNFVDSHKPLQDKHEKIDYEKLIATLLNQKALPQKMEALAILKRYSNAAQFQQVMKPLIESSDFMLIKDSMIKNELIILVGASGYHELALTLQRLLDQNEDNLDDFIVEQIHDSINQLHQAKRITRKQAQVFGPHRNQPDLHVDLYKKGQVNSFGLDMRLGNISLQASNNESKLNNSVSMARAQPLNLFRNDSSSNRPSISMAHQQLNL